MRAERRHTIRPRSDVIMDTHNYVSSAERERDSSGFQSYLPETGVSSFWKRKSCSCASVCLSVRRRRWQLEIHRYNLRVDH